MSFSHSIIRKAQYIFFSLLYLCLFSLHSFASSLPLALPDNAEKAEEQWHLVADFLDTLDNGAIIEARGDVVLTRGNDILRADFARYYTATDWIFVRKNVYVKLGKDELVANEAEFNLETSTGFLQDGHIFMSGPHLYFEGEHVKKYFGDSYAFNNATITACDPADPAWKMRASRATVEIDGYATLYSANFDVGILSSPPIPYMVLPAKRTRQTGLLKPDFGVSTLHGYYYSQPWFWAIGSSRDITLTASYFNVSGVMLSGEYRSHTTQNEKTWFAVDYLFSNKNSDFSQINYAETNYKDRFWIRGMSDGRIKDTEWKYKVDIDYVSDSSFLIDYQTMLTGFDNTNDAAYDFFGREFAQISKNRVSTGYLFREFNDSYVTFGFEYNQNPAYGTSLASDDDTTVQTLPELNAYFYPITPIEGSPLQLDGYVGTSYSYRTSGTSGARAEIRPRLSIPIDLGFTTLLAQGAFTNRTYFASTNSVTNAPLEDSDQIQKTLNDILFDFKIQGLMQGSRIWQLESNLEAIAENIGKSEYSAIKHLFEPRLSYTFIENKDQDELPYYSQADRILQTNAIELSLRNVISAQKTSVRQSKNALGEDIPLLATSTSTLGRFTLSSGYNFEEAQRKDYVDQYPRMPFNDLSLESEAFVWGLSLSSQLDVSLYGYGVTRFDLGMNVPLFGLSKYLKWNTAVSYRNTMYDYQNIVTYASSEDIELNEKVALLRNKVTFTPTSYLSLYIDYYVNLEKANTYQIELIGSYKHDCFSISANYKYTQNEQVYGLSITIPGIFD